MGLLTVKRTYMYQLELGIPNCLKLRKKHKCLEVGAFMLF
jgi:hypothetical protein